MMAYNGRDEATTRKELIDHQLRLAGWDVANPSMVEIELGLKYGAAASDGIRDRSKESEFLDYALLDSTAIPLAVVEAKREGRDALAGKRQAEDYAQGIQQVHKRTPFIFLTNGHEIWFYEWGYAPPRKVSGFFNRNDLERLRFQRENRTVISNQVPKRSIVDRPYQIEAVKRVAEGLE
ncbi:MAG: restriction endonuclease subunit R, partial [Gammaproteobacteria bacterium]